MTISKHCKYQGDIDELTNRFSVFSQLKKFQFDTSLHSRWNYKTKDSTHRECKGGFAEYGFEYAQSLREGVNWQSKLTHLGV